ncbi:MAG: ABC transporter permease [Planctomycetes bacterium]|nr:ABC transporter permease [Planctomycetota bacterium]
MNGPTMRALLLDAFYQVLDNKIFRLLLILEFGIVAAFFLVGFRETEVQVLWGAWTLPYEDVFSFFGQKLSPGSDLQGMLVQRVQSLVVETLSGSIGMIVCLSATAFFLPRMLEKGAADIVFAKPVSRFALMLSRYASGLFFVGILAVVGTFGIWLGLLVSSGYNDPGVLWGALTLVYLFGILHAFSCFVGVLTRSTVAAILMSVVFFMGTGCIHGTWTAVSWGRESEAADALRVQMEAGSGDEAADAAKAAKDAQKAEDEAPWILRALLGVLDGLHYALPKTSDADVLTRKLRKAVEGEPWRIVDDETRLSITELPGGMEVVEPKNGALHVDLGKAALVFAAREGETEKGRIQLARRTRVVERPDASGKGTRTRKLSTQQALDELVERARRAGSIVGDVTVEKTEVDGLYALAARWSEAGAQRTVHVMTFGDWIVEIDARYAADWQPPESRTRAGPPGSSARGSIEQQARHLRLFLTQVHLARQVDIPDPNTWYEKRFTWTAPLSSNIGFSIGSSLLFVVLMLGLAWWKLQKIEF